MGTIPHHQNPTAVQNIPVKHLVDAVQNFFQGVVKQMFRLPLERVLHLQSDIDVRSFSKQ
jgi:hypothetical protein